MWMLLMEQRYSTVCEILISRAISRLAFSCGRYVMCAYLVTRHDRVNGAFRGYVRACTSLASAEALVGWLNKCQVLAELYGLNFSYGVEVKENLSESRNDLLVTSHGLYGLI